MSEKIIVELLDRRNLTPRESEIALLVCEGLSDKAIARVLAISIKTLSTHLEHIYGKLQVRRHSVNTRCAAISALVGRGMVRLSNTALCILLMVSAIDLDNQAARVGRLTQLRTISLRVKSRELDS